MLDLLAARGLTDVVQHPLTFGDRHASTSAPSPAIGRRPMAADRPLVLAMTGASGAPYAVRLLQALCRGRAGPST